MLLASKGSFLQLSSLIPLHFSQGLTLWQEEMSQRSQNVKGAPPQTCHFGSLSVTDNSVRDCQPL